MTTEIILALLMNVKVAFSLFSLIAGTIALVMGVIWLSVKTSGYESEQTIAKAWSCFKISTLATVVFIIPALIPDINDVWKVRISLIKLQLASPQNVQKGVDEIGRIAKKLECKYLECEKPKESK